MSLPASASGSTQHARVRFLAAQEARAVRFAHLCAGEPALEWAQQAMRTFARRARRQPEARWPVLFWSILLRKLPAVEATQMSPALAAASASSTFLDLGVLEAALTTLSADERRVFLLRTWIGLDLDQCAAVLGRKPAATTAALFSALRQMRGCLKAKPGDDFWLLRTRLLLEAGVDLLGADTRGALAHARTEALQPRGAVGRKMIVLGSAAIASLLLALGIGSLIPGGSNREHPTPLQSAPPSLALRLVEPTEQALTLPPEDLALLASRLDIESLAELEMHMWLLDQPVRR